MLLWLPLLVLAALQDPDIDALLKQLEDESIEVRDKAAAKLIDLGDKAEEKVKARLAAADGALRQTCQRILEQMAVPKKLRGLLPPLRKVTIDAKDKSLREVMEELRQQSGMPLEVERVPESPVTVSLRDLTPLAALDAVCKAASLGYFFDSDAFGMGKVRAMPGAVGAPQGPWPAGGELKIRFQPGQYFDAPRLFVRHYLLEPTNISLTRSTSFRASNSNASLSLRVAWSPDVRPQTGNVVLNAVTDDQGRSLLLPRMVKNFTGSRPAFGSLQSSFQLAYPEADAKSIARIAGTATLKYLLEEKLVTIEAPEKAEPQKKELGGITVEFQECKVVDGQATVRLVITGRMSQDASEGWQSYNAPVRLKLENGNYAQSSGTSMTGYGSPVVTYQMNYAVSGKIAAVEVVAETTYHTDTFDFELKDIPFPK